MASLKLMPGEPPGRATRKARQFEAEIARLRAEGYTLAAIRRSLAAAGVEVSLATIRRELKRPTRALPITMATAVPAVTSPGLLIGSAATHSAPAHAASRPQQPGAQPSAAELCEQPSGKDLAQAFCSSQNHHPLKRAKENP
ncbi:helix-turn-helix domain-containing protein [Paucibacter sp. M5-1]|uniref:helix-turn-helix domain-containing protein n=1 Tax=Paucibacter sp. M5-1 TaxID=3015998 RepID=UPI0022B8E719|nr:helix-turn-helix domain-containing protein [Paucibacter sp. M5-1]MCZ7880556.1 helix-turn-helix domain-containing protein [Paucibacter sp. M5-1]